MSAATPQFATAIAEPTWLRFSIRSLLIVTLLAGVVVGGYAWRGHRLRRQKAVVDSLRAFGAATPEGPGDVVQLSFAGDAFRGQALDKLSQLPFLKKLVLIDAPVSDADLKRLLDLHLEELRCINAPGITDQGVKVLGQMHSLKVLWLEQSVITDAALGELARLPQLDVLNLIGARITDQGVVNLAPAEHLKELLVHQTAVTRAGADELQRALPKLVIKYDQ